MGKEEVAGNYKLLSLTSVPGKIMEKVVLRFSDEYLKDNGGIGQSQHGFVRGKYCLTNLICFYN